MTQATAVAPQTKAPKLTVRKVKGKKKLPPGQRLLLYMFLAASVSLITANLIPHGKTEAVPQVTTVIEVMPFPLTSRLTSLEDELAKLSDKKKLRTGLFVVEPAIGRYAEMNGRQPFMAASMIKVPVLVSLLAALDRKAVSLTEKLTISKDLITGGSGYLQWRPVDSKITVKEAAELMIIISDNTATNLLIDRLGGLEKLNKQYASWGLKNTKLNNLLADLDGTNTTSPYDLCYMMGRIERGELISQSSRDWMYSIMHRTRIKTLLPQGLNPGDRIFHKTGDIGKMVGDVGLVHTKDGKRYLVSVQVERPHNDRRANELIRTLSRAIHGTIIKPADGAVDETIAGTDSTIRAAADQTSRHP
jgi:beta-lactamase class A